MFLLKAVWAAFLLFPPNTSAKTLFGPIVCGKGAGTQLEGCVQEKKKQIEENRYEKVIFSKLT